VRLGVDCCVCPRLETKLRPMNGHRSPWCALSSVVLTAIDLAACAVDHGRAAGQDAAVPGGGGNSSTGGLNSSPAALPHAVALRPTCGEPSLYDQLAYAITGNRVVRYDGNYWSQFGDPRGPIDDVHAFGLWASRDAVVAVGAGGQVYRYRGDSSVPDLRLTAMLTDASAPADNSAVWGFASNDVWIGTADGQLVHDDGQNFSVAWSGQGDCRAIRAMWGRDGVLFFATGSLVFRWRNGSVDPILSVPCDLAEGLVVRSLWGDSPAEVFIAVQDASATSCGSGELFWFDGERIAPL
jgi:hypothetical protein